VRVAALYDVHGNVPALEAVLADVERSDVERVLFGGDIASGPLPRETVELVRSLDDAVFVRGNADVLGSPSMTPEWDEARRWVERQLEDEQVEWLANLPFSAEIDDVLYVHATPQDVETVITERTTDERLAGLLAGVGQPLVVAGHTHMRLDRTVGSTRFVNPGSVGLPYEGERGAYWGVVENGEVEFRRTEYDVDEAARRIRASAHPRAAEFEQCVVEVPTREAALAMFGG
jgi:putative phosphoesterase